MAKKNKKCIMQKSGEYLIITTRGYSYHSCVLYPSISIEFIPPTKTSLPTCSIYSILLFEILLVLSGTVLIPQYPSWNCFFFINLWAKEHFRFKVTNVAKKI